MKGIVNQWVPDAPYSTRFRSTSGGSIIRGRSGSIFRGRNQWPKSLPNSMSRFLRFGTINDSNRIFCCCSIMDIINQGTELPVD